MLHKYEFAIALIIASIILSSCTTMFISPEKNIENGPNTDTDIPIYMIGDEIDFPYKVNCHLQVQVSQKFESSPFNCRDGLKSSDLKNVKKLANTVGADAVIGLTRSEYFGWSYAWAFASGLAVNYQENDCKGGCAEGLVTCVLPIASSSQGEEAIQLDLETRQLSRGVLSGKGYYVLTPHTDLTTNELDIEKIVLNYDIKNICGLEPDIIVKFYSIGSAEEPKLVADAYSIKDSTYIMVGSKAEPDPFQAEKLLGGPVLYLIYRELSEDESAIQNLLDPIPEIKLQQVR